MRLVLSALVLCAMACGGPTQSDRAGSPSADSAGQPAAPRTITMIVRYEVTDLAGKIPGSSSPVVTKRLFNAALALIDKDGEAQPYLAAALPKLNSESWRVSIDGRMETTYRLRAGLTWHDGLPLDADDFVFAARIYGNPAFSLFNPQPQDRIERVEAPDPATVVITWHSIYPGAGALAFGDLDPLPRHILGTPLTSVEDGGMSGDSFQNLPFWTNEYVGAGPYRLERWTPGAEFDTRAFAGHALGKAKIDRVLVRIVNDENTVLSSVLAGESDLTVDFTLRFEHALVLRRDWESSGKGKVILRPSGSITQMLQLRPEFVGHPGQLDVRVRRALAHATDRQALNEGLFEGQGFSGENLVPPTVPYFSTVDQVIAKYPLNTRQAEQFMAEAGYSKDRDGFFAGVSGERFRTDVRVTAGPEFERGQAILVDSWKRAGFDVTSSILAAAQARDREARQSFPGMGSRGGGFAESSMTTAEIGSAANRWTGENRGGYSNAEYDRLYDAYTRTLEPSERVRQVTQMMKILSEDLPVYSLYLAYQVNTVRARLSGPDPGTSGFGALTPGTLPYWNIQDWDVS